MLLCGTNTVLARTRRPSAAGDWRLCLKSFLFFYIFSEDAVQQLYTSTQSQHTAPLTLIHGSIRLLSKRNRTLRDPLCRELHPELCSRRHLFFSVFGGGGGGGGGRDRHKNRDIQSESGDRQTDRQTERQRERERETDKQTGKRVNE